MSTVTYALLTNRRDAAEPNTSKTISPGIGYYADVLSALVPAEVLGLHALIISLATTTTFNKITMEKITSIHDLPTLSLVFWGLIIFSWALYAWPRYRSGLWDRCDFLRMLIPPVAFAGWTMLQRITAFDAAFPSLDSFPRTVIALFIAAACAPLAVGLAKKADEKPPPQ